MKQIVFISILLSLLCAGCTGEGEGEGEDEWKEDNISSLEGTRWKLIGIKDGTGSPRAPDPGPILGPIDHREKSYTLEFDTDSTLLTFSSTNELGGGYIADYETYSVQVFYFGGTKVGEVGDGKLYSDLFWHGHLQSFSVSGDKLRLYYNNKKNYLLYKLQQP